MKRKITRKYIQCKEAYLDGFEEGFQRAYHLGEISKQVEYGERFNDVKEPLIKDERIRKAVRAWAEANIIHQVEFEYIAGTGSIFKDGICGVKIGLYDDLKLTNRETYTIAELCGEEKE